jgi:uncharacterized protein with FMN-binding domain
MPKRGIAALAITVVALVLLLSFKTPDVVPARGGGVAIVEPGSTATPSGASGATSDPAPAPAVDSTPTPTPTPTVSSGSGTTSAASATVDGPVIDTRYGPIQVEVVVANGQLQDVVAIQLPTGRRSGQISNAAAPILREEALQAQSASIDTVSGATYTSDAYAQSLQAALDQAGLG